MDWLDRKGDSIGNILNANCPNMNDIEKLLQTTLMEDTEPKAWIEQFFKYLQHQDWISDYCKLGNSCASDDEVEISEQLESEDDDISA